MINFGVREEAIAKTAASPGWAYVPDTGKKGPVAALQPSSRKRAARTQATASSHDTTAKQDAKILRELIALDKETLSSKTEVIPVPIRHRDNAGRVSHGKVTPDVRKILQSKKTWANYLDDFEALGHIQPAAPAAPATPIVRAAPGTATPHLTSKGTRSHKKKDPNAPPISTPLRKVSTPSQVTPIAVKPEASTDIPMPDAPVLSIPDIPPPPPHPGDNDPLLVSKIPNMPTQAEIEKLLAAPPLTYNEARGEWSEEDKRKPIRTFCEICGYWGRVRCTRCGGRVCALECLTVHQEECFTRYGA